MENNITAPLTSVFKKPKPTYFRNTCITNTTQKENASKRLGIPKSNRRVPENTWRQRSNLRNRRKKKIGKTAKKLKESPFLLSHF